jgi:hypothetical protein
MLLIRSTVCLFLLWFLSLSRHSNNVFNSMSIIMISQNHFWLYIPSLQERRLTFPVEVFVIFYTYDRILMVDTFS